MERKLIREMVLQLRQNNIDENTDRNMKNIFENINKLLLKKENSKDLENPVLEDLVKVVRNLLEAYKIGDVVLIADVLEYELLELTERLER